MRHLLKLLTVLPLTTLLLVGCSLLPEQIDETKGWSVQRLYSEAKEAMSEGNYQTAIGYLDKIQARYPFGRYAQQAQIDTIYCQYKDGEPDAAIAAADRFIKANPRHPYVDYAYYMKGLVNFQRSNTLFDRLAPVDRSKTDTNTARQSFNDFSELVRKFPSSQYAEDSRQRILFLHNSLAVYETNVADYYLRRGAYVAAVNRAKYVLETYARTSATENALSIMTQAYVKMGMPQLAADSLRVLERNYPQSSELPKLNALIKGTG
ncbi:MAG: outer membrane protein assembly factor BamD [Gammaproteobacteria bacterium]|nr:outer membrane protein assembly factor BamD [Gammaproteobacteria bacterium]MCP5196616.1 outer membrane protein assembly factor BamD [Gammaproteobacteria bacterium]